MELDSGIQVPRVKLGSQGLEVRENTIFVPFSTSNFTLMLCVRAFFLSVELKVICSWSYDFLFPPNNSLEIDFSEPNLRIILYNHHHHCYLTLLNTVLWLIFILRK